MSKNVFRTATAWLCLLAVVTLTTPALAANDPASPSNYAAARRLAHAILRGEAPAVSLPDAARIPVAEAGFESAKAPKGLTGTWFCTVPGTPDVPGFNAYQTFGADGTFVETSSLLGTLIEGPAHGTWVKSGSKYLLTFELFSFDANGQTIGRARVRNLITKTGNDSFSSECVVDVIDLEGNEIPAVATAEFTAVRVQARSL